MDDLKLIKVWMSETPEPDEGTKEHARVRLLRQMRTPAAEHSRGRSRSYRLALIAATVTLAAVLTVAGAGLIPGERATQVSAAEVLRRAGGIAAEGSPVLETGQYLYTKSQGRVEVYLSAAPGKSEATTRDFFRESWIALDGSGRIHQVEGDQESDETFGPGELLVQDLSGLPTDPDLLRAKLAEMVAGTDGPPTDVLMFVTINEMLSESYAPPEVRRALYEVAATLPRVESLGEVTDHAGRGGIGVGYTWQGVREELILDPATAAVLEIRRTQISSPGSVLSWSTVMESGVVESTDVSP